MQTKTPVIFYTASYLNDEPTQTGITETIAVFPNTVNDYPETELLTSYAHIGQHTPVSNDFIKEYCTELTDIKDYEELKQELENIVGYNLLIQNSNNFTYIIYLDSKEINRFENQESDSCVFKYLLNKQSQSVSYALKHGGYSVKIMNQSTQEITNY